MPPRAASKTAKRASKAPVKRASKAPAKKASKAPVKGSKKPENKCVTAKAGAAGSLSKNGGSKEPRRKYRPFSDEESKALVVGVKRYGLGNWTRIHDDPDLPFMSTQRTPMDLKDKWRVLSKKLPQEQIHTAMPSGTEQAAGVEVPPQYSREHLVLLPYHELVTLVLSWQTYHHYQQQGHFASNGDQTAPISSAQTHHYQQQRTSAASGDQTASIFSAPNGPAPHSVPNAASNLLGKTRRRDEKAGEGTKRRRNDTDGSTGIPASTVSLLSNGSATATTHATRAAVDLNTEAAAEQMTMLSPTLVPTMASQAPAPIDGGSSSGNTQTDHRVPALRSPSMRAVPMSPPTHSSLSPPAVRHQMSSSQRMTTVSVDQVLGRVTDGASNFPGRLPPSGSLADPRASAGPKINLTSLSDHNEEDAHSVDNRVARGPNAGRSQVHQSPTRGAALEMLQQGRDRAQRQGGSADLQRSGHGASAKLAASQSTERLNERLNDSAVNVFPIGRSRSQEGFDTLRMVASRSAEQLGNLAASDSLADLASRSAEVGARITWHHQMQTGQAKAIEEWMPETETENKNADKTST